jgi:hypothetical protein
LSQPDHVPHTLPTAEEATIAALAEQTATDTAVVKDLYQEEITQLEAHSSVKNFIGVIAARRVRQRLAASPEQKHPTNARVLRRSRAVAPPRRPLP